MSVAVAPLRSVALATAVSLFVLASAAAQASLYGSGCSGQQPAPQIAFSGSTTPGESATVHLTGAPPTGVAVAIIGTQQSSVDLSSTPGVNAGCTLLNSADIVLVMNADGLGEIDLSFKVPETFGTQLFFQWAAVEDDDPLSVTFTQGLALDLTKTVTPSTGQLDFGAARVDGGSVVLPLQLDNATDGPVTIEDALVFDGGAAAYAVGFADPTPIELAPGASTSLDVTFDPAAMGQADATMTIAHADLPPGFSEPEVALTGVGLGPPGDDLFVNAGGDTYFDSQQQLWAAELGASGGQAATTADPVSGTSDPELYQSSRQGLAFSYALPVPDATYDVTLHFVEDSAIAPNRRVFDVLAEDTLVLDDLDLFALVGQDVAYSVTVAVVVSDGELDLEFASIEGDATVSALEIRSRFAALDVQPASFDFGAVLLGETSSLPITLENVGNDTLELDSVGISIGPLGGTGDQITLTLDGTTYTGGTDDVVLPASLTLVPGRQLVGDLEFAPTNHVENDLTLELAGNFETVSVPVFGFGAEGEGTFLHVVIEPIVQTVDYDLDGTEKVQLDGSFSHTHEPGQQIVGFSWTEGGVEILDVASARVDFDAGPHTVCLEITDDKDPPESLTDCVDFEVLSPDAVTGVLAEYYAPPGGETAEDLLDAVPADPDFIEVIEQLLVVDNGGAIGGSTFSENVMVRLTAQVDLAADTYDFQLVGGSDTRLFVDGAAFAGPAALAAGQHEIEARFAVATGLDLPLEVLMAQDQGPFLPLDASELTHDETAQLPYIFAMQDEGIPAGGNDIVITGFGFFPFADVVVHWGDVDLVETDFDAIDATTIAFDSPPGPPGTIPVTVETPLGTSNARTFTYTDGGAIPIAFTSSTPATGIPLPTSGTWGPDGRLYVAERFGQIHALTFDEEYALVSDEVFAGVSGLSNNEVLGLAVDPFDAPSPVRLYVAHSQLYAQGGGSFSGPAPYPGQVSVLTGPDFDDPVPLVTQLPTSNHDHGVNGMVFDNNGDLLVALGGNTNAGVAWPDMGDLPESPLTAAILEAETSREDFDGAISYVETDTGVPNDDQVAGGIVDVAPGAHVGVFAPGLRNPYDLVLTLDGRVYATDNGPNTGFGPLSTGPDTQGGQPATPDEVLLVERDRYYGHPNRNRGRDDARQNVYEGSSEPTVPGVYTAPLVELSSSVDGIDEYRATTFQGAMRGDLIVQRWAGMLKRLARSADGRSITTSSDLLNLGALDVVAGPGGAIVGMHYSSDSIRVMEPDDAGAAAMQAYDIFPWRATPDGGYPFVIGGVGFGSPADTSVTIGGLAATVTSVTGKRIEGTVPAQPSPTTELLDVVVSSGGLLSTIPNGFRFLMPGPGQEPGIWEAGPTMPIPLGEVAGGVIEGVLYLVGELDVDTLALDLEAGTWSTSPALRPFAGNHHAAEVVDGELYLFGGLLGGSEGKVQIYDPDTDTWTVGADMPWAAGSVNTSLIDGLVYVAGGIVGSSTVSNVAAYDPQTDSWSALLAPMPKGRNHAAAATDGERMFVFGGREGGNVVTNGFDDVQIYDPSTDTWEFDTQGGSTLEPLPLARGGMGKAVFYQGEFYVFGGETQSGGGATPDGVYDRVDVYDPVENAWRLETPMPTARHGIFPMLYENRIWIAGGGTEAALSQSDVVEIFSRP